MTDLFVELDRRLVCCMRCPVCGAEMRVSEDARSLLCRGGRAHCFDGGGAGYLPLAPRHPGGGDAKEAVRARSLFLDSGYYAPARDALVRLACEQLPPGGCILDAGCGEGYYASGLTERGFSVLGIDLSKFAVRAAARRARDDRARTGCDTSQTIFAVSSVFDLPVKDGCMDGVTNVFAPCAPAEYARVLKPGGKLILAGAAPEHLMGLKQLLYDDPYVNDERRDLPGADVPLILTHRETVTFDITIEGREELDALFSMTPYYWRTGREGRDRLSRADRMETPVSFELFVYTKMEK